MNVLHVASNIDPASGGPAVAIAGLLRAQLAAGLSPRLVLTYPGGRSDAFARDLAAAGVPTEAIGPCGGKINRHPAIRPALDRLVPAADVVHVHAVWEQIQHDAAVACRRHRVPYVVTPHGMLDPWSLRQRALIKRVFLAWRVRQDLDAAAALHYITAVERDLAKPLRLRPAAVVEPIGLDIGEFRNLPPKGRFRGRHAIPADATVVLFLGRIHYKKGLDLLIPAFARAAGAPARLVIAGPDETDYAHEARRLVEANGLGDRTTFSGMLHGPERVEALVDADLFALTSYQENFGIAVIEALAAGTPVLISDQVATWQELKAAGVAGVVPTRVEAVTAELARWLGDPGMRRDAGGRARRFALDHYDWGTIARRWAERYERVRATFNVVLRA